MAPREPRCSPGLYEGMFSCLISGLLPWQGKMSFALEEKTTVALEFPILEIVPGTQISGNDDSFQGMFMAELEGTFECQTGVLTGAMKNGKYLFGGFMEYQLQGKLAGNYVSDGGVRAFQGMMGPLTSKDFEILGPLGPSATCTWHAARTGGVAASDGGRAAGKDGGR